MCQELCQALGIQSWKDTFSALKELSLSGKQMHKQIISEWIDLLPSPHYEGL